MSSETDRLRHLEHYAADLERRLAELEQRQEQLYQIILALSDGFEHQQVALEAFGASMAEQGESGGAEPPTNN